MTKTSPQQPGVEQAPPQPRFHVVPHPSHGWAIIDLHRPDDPMALCPHDEADAPRIVLALNTFSRLLVDDPEPYMVADVERVRDNLARLSIETARQAFTAAQSGDQQSCALLDAEAQFLGLAADLFRRLMSELLKFRMIEDRVPAMVDALRHSALTFRVNESATREKARRDGAELDDPSLVAGIERAAEAWAQAAELCERALGIEGGSLVGAEVTPGRCRICGCTEDRACSIVTPGTDAGAAIPGHFGQRPCGWADDTRTLCDAPNCLARAEPPTPPQRHEAANRDRVRIHDGRDGVLSRPDVAEAVAYSIATRRGADWAKATEEGRNAFREEAGQLLSIAARCPRA